ncbi:hypothetical protein [Aureimonas sp. Leaf324]|jgi:hypothetical protein|uniref:hypothetical protein n=1 Tax=Aureimonas sp. Leaf324 TaxID=1736336 RepID=UPI0006FD3581|nr:hypothetical protein [Aureimonas sp. Leaf324]KQQ89572.1 hypothetical protein ASF65_16885 [Aureimonas sp. Leaf324]
MTHRMTTALCAALLWSAVPAGAQTTSPPAPAPSVPDTGAQAIPPSTDPCAAQPGAADGQTLSGQLADCGGVLTPPDTGMPSVEAPVPAPDPGTTPVIPPGTVPDEPNATGSANPT